MNYNVYQETKMSSDFIEIAKRESNCEEYIRLHSHSFYEMVFVISGSCKYIIGDREYEAKTGNIILIPPGKVHQVIFSKGITETYERFIVWIDADWWNKVKEISPDIDFAFDYCSKHNNYLLCTPDATSKGLEVGFVQMLKEIENKKLNWEICSISYGIALMSHINRTYYYLKASPTKKHQDTLLEKMVSYIDSNLHTKISIGSIAKALHVSPSTLSHMCKEELNVSLYHFVIQRRLIIAKNNIMAGIELNKVWENIGFADYSAFFRAFKREYGISPREFKKVNMKK